MNKFHWWWLPLAGLVFMIFFYAATLFGSYFIDLDSAPMGF